MRNRASSRQEEREALVGYGRALLGRAVKAAWSRGLLSREKDAVYTDILTAVEIDRLLAESTVSPPLEALADGTPLRLRDLSERIDCQGAEAVVVLALAVELDATARMLASYLRGGMRSGALTFGTLALALGDGAISDLVFLLGDGSSLLRYRLVEVSLERGELLSTATVCATARLLRWWIEPTGLDEEIRDIAVLHLPQNSIPLAPVAVDILGPAVREVSRFVEGVRHGKVGLGDLVLRGPRGAGRSELAREACARLGISVIVASVDAILAQPDPARATHALLREALLLDAQLVLQGGEALSSGAEGVARLRAALGSSRQPLVITASHIDEPRLVAGRAQVIYDVPLLAVHEREAVWRQVLPGVSASQLASLYRVGAGAIGRITEATRVRATVRSAGAPTADDVAQAVRDEFASDLGTVATRVEVTQTWDDLVIPEETGRTITELVDQLRHRSTVLGQWGFSRKLGKGLGTVALFSGEPGTGKSMVASLIARALGLELYQIDLSRVMSKWIGETEKNLAKLFDAAETGHVVLLFDEADALLGRRATEIKSATDRYANVETNYVLQRLEAFHGVAILTSNLESAIDPALSRRLSFELRFPFPDEEQRAELWRRMIPAEAPVKGEIDFRLLAERFELAGGHIRNIVLRAAYLAAAEEGALSMATLLRAAEYEYRDHGMLVAKGRLRT